MHNLLILLTFILRSVDSIGWTQLEFGTDADLSAVGSFGSEVVVAGQDAPVLLSADSGQDWTDKHSIGDIDLCAVVISPWQIDAGGMDQGAGDAALMKSEYRGVTSNMVKSLPQTGHFVTDLLYASGLSGG
jgi:hypothetical protein